MHVCLAALRSVAGLIAATLVAGCAPSAFSPAAGAGTPSGNAAEAHHRAGSASWAAPDARSIDLLYVSDLNNNAVYLYSYPKGVLKGTLTGFVSPHGLCSDANGNVFVADGGANEIVEFAHGGTTPIATLSEPGYFVKSCSIDPQTGDLAVTADPPSSSPGSIFVFKHATGKPKLLTTPNVFRIYFGGYDAAGDLFVDGTDFHVAFEFAELPAGAKSFQAIALNHSINLPGDIEWDGTFLAVGDQVSIAGPSAIDRFSIAGTTGTYHGSVQMTDSCDVLGFRIEKRRVIAANDCTPTVQYFAYPKGGTATKTLAGELSQPVGVTVSPAQ